MSPEVEQGFLVLADVSGYTGFLAGIELEHASGILSSLHFRPRHRVISLVAGLDLQTVPSLVKPATAVHRVNPLPPIERGEGPILLYPPDDAVVALLSLIVATAIFTPTDETPSRAWTVEGRQPPETDS